ncbi:filamentous haemagglutinin family protein [Bradyrhizobium cenepequi]
MNERAPEPSIARRPAHRRALLAGVSALALLMHAHHAHARPLGGAGTAPSAVSAASNGAAADAARAAAVAAQSSAALKRATAAIQAMQAAQAAAHTAAGSANAVPNGLGAGGLLLDPTRSLTGTDAPTQSVDASGQTQVDIRQTAAQAILNWKSFNVGARTTLTFDQQGNANWVALNRVVDGTSPSQILGNIKADGQVYIINQNGIIFGGTSQINVGSLIASTADITNSQFRTNGIYSTQSGTTYAPSFTGAGGAVSVEAGAQITTHAPASATSGGGYVLLMGTQVSNAGLIQTPNGQAALAAGDSFVLRAGYSTTANTSSTTRGNEIAPLFGSGSLSGAVSNSGLIYSQQGDITLAGHAVTQDGVLLSTTSVNQRGTIHLLNSASDSTGRVTLTGNAVTAILPETDSDAIALNSKRDALIADSATQNVTRAGVAVGAFDNLSLLADREDLSRIEIVSGGLVNFQKGSLIQAQGGQIAVSAGQRVFAENGATLDVSGTTGTVLPMSVNNIEVNVQGNELRDSPDNRNSGSLFNANVWIDARDLTLVPAGTGGYATDRYYTAGGLLEVSGYLNNTGHRIGEWTAVGGSITLAAPEVIAQRGSTFNISGGSVSYAPGYVMTSNLLGADGRLYNIGKAPADVKFAALAGSFMRSHRIQGQVDDRLTEIWASPFGKGAVNLRWEDGYTAGRDAGSLILSTPTSLFEGQIVAGVIDGERQRNARPAGVTDGYKLTQNVAPLAGTLALGQYTARGLAGAYGTDVVFGNVAANVAGSMSAASSVPTERTDTAWFDAPTLGSFGLGGLNIASADSIKVNAPLSFAPGAQVKLVAPTVDVAADITARSGTVTVSNMLTSAAVGTKTLTTPSRGADLTLRSGVTIDARGSWVNETTDPDSAANLGFLNGGSVTFDSSQNVTLAAGSAIDVSSGGAILATGKTQGGKGGNVTIIAGHAQQDAGTPGDGTLVLDGAIRAWGVTGGGTLTISSPGNIVIGDNAELAGGVLTAGTPAPVALTLKQSLTIPAGTPLPVALTQTFTTITFDAPTPVDIKLNGDTWTRGATGADWTLPDGVALKGADGNYYSNNATVPAGTVISYFYGYNLPKGSVVPSAVFPNGLPIDPYQVTYAPGSVQSKPMTYPNGYTISAGAVLPVTVAVAPAPALNPSFFTAGFSNYDINGGQGVLVANNTVLAPTMPVYRFSADSYAARSGSDPSSALSLWLPPLFSENPTSATLTQRGGASVTLRSLIRSGTGPLVDGGAIVVSDGASINVDPGRSINLDAFGQITVLGNLTARGGSISLVNDADGSTLDKGRNFDAAGNGRGVSIWIDANARVDVSGLAYRAFNSAGHPYGQATDGGAIAINGGGAFVIIRPGAELDADGTQVAIDLAAGGNAQAPSQPLTLATGGGSITLSSQSGLYLDGNLHAVAGGAGASGGSLSIALTTPIFVSQSFPFDTNTWSYLIPANAVLPSVMTVVQGRPDPVLPADIAPGTKAASLMFGRATVSADMVKDGGFDSLTLNSGDYMQFSGNVSLALGRSLTLTAASFTSGAPVSGPIDSSMQPTTGNVKVSAPYILFREPVSNVPDGSSSASIRNPSGAAVPTIATFEADADQIDIQGLVQFSARAPNNMYAPGFLTTKLVSQGDIRFLSMAGVITTQLATSGNLDLLAAQLYPATNTLAAVIAGSGNSDPTVTLTIGRTTDTIPDAPLSVFGSLAFQAPIVEQGGIVRAPFGSLTFGMGYPVFTPRVDLLPGSLTSVSMAGMTIPYGGTIDGVTYSYNGASVRPIALTNYGNAGNWSGIVLDGQSVNVAKGAILDLSGGGALSGAGFVSGRGGSVNVLTTPLVNANPATPLSKAGDKVYAIVPGYASSYAPVAPENGAGDPVIGQQVTIPAGVPGLPAGTYTLLPSNYALLPGAYRVELGGSTTTPIASPTAIGNGTYAASVSTGIANTAIRSRLPVTALITSGSSVRKYSQYNEQSYSDFQIANVTQFGGVRPLLPVDAKALQVKVEAPSSPATGSALTFDGTALFQGAQGGIAGQVLLQGAGEIYADAPTAGFTSGSVRAADLNALGAPRLMVNGYNGIINGAITFQGGSNIVIRDGVTLRAGEIFLVGGNISVGNNVTLTTIGQGAAPFDSDSTGMGYNTAYGVSVLALSNGALNFLGSQGSGAITIGAGAQLYSEGTLAFATNGASTIAQSAHFGSRNIALALGTINVGDSATVAAAGAPAGLLFDQELLNALLKGDPLHGAPALEKITLSASNSINVFGSAGIDATGTGVDLVLNTPALYGYGTSGDRATIAANKITWNGLAGATPPAIAAGGPGTGSGTLDLVADEIDFGRFVWLDTTSVSRVVYGFGNVNITGRSQIVSAGNGKLYVYQSPSSDPAAVFGQSGVGANLTLTTPLLTGVQKSVMAYAAGGALNVVAPAGTAPSDAKSTVSGAEIDLTGDSIAIGSTILLPSGKLVVNATNNIALNDGSRIDLSGQPSQIQKATVYGFGGTAIFNSAQGGVTQTAGSTIDVSATNASAGSISISAVDGPVALQGALNGTATGGYTSGDFSVTTATLSNPDFAALNVRLTEGGFFDARSFDIRTGDLVITDGVKARNVTVSVDGGSLTVAGTIDASGAAPGTIRLSAGNGLTLAASAVLDARGTVLQTDSYGQPIEARNRGHIELTAAGGTLTLSPGATMDLSTSNGVAYGDVQLNAQRTGETSGDIAIEATGPLNIRGAYSIALNAFWTYDLPGGSTVTQSTLDGYDTASTAFINAALGNGALQGKIAGLSSYGRAFHLRPGVQITSSGDISTSGDIDLAKYRYGATADRDPNSATYGAGEPMALVVRAAGGLTVRGGISDGFKSSAGIPATVTIIDLTNISFFSQRTFNGYTFWQDDNTDVVVMNDWTIPNNAFYNWWTFEYWGNLVDSNNNAYNPGDTIPAGTIISAGNSFGFAFEPSNMPIVGVVTSAAVPGAAATAPAASMLAPGSLSASIRLVSGADLAAADQRALQTARALNGRGNLTLNDPAYNSSLNGTFFSVVRTGTGNLDLLAGGSFSEATPYGVYTAGTQSAPILAADGSNPYDVVGAASSGASHAWYPEHGGDLLLTAQQDVTGNIQIFNNNTRSVDSDLTSNWFGRQGGGVSADPTAWWINFGSYAKTGNTQQLVGFQGIGTLGGGNLTVIAGGNAGVTGNGSTGLDLAVASTGRVLADGTLLQTGGGDLTLKVGGKLNFVSPALSSQVPDYYGSITDLRGDIVVKAGSIGAFAVNNGGAAFTSVDPRATDPNIFKRSLKTPGPIFTPGDSTVSIMTRGDLVFGGAGDAGMGALVDQKGIPYTLRNADGTTTLVASGGQSSFTLWRPATAINLYSAGGDVAPLTGTAFNAVENSNGFYPGTLIVAAANGDIRFAEPVSAAQTFAVLELMPSPSGQLELLAAGSIYGSTQVVAMSGADMSTLATPFRPVFNTGVGGAGKTNASPTSAYMLNQSNPIAFGEDTPISNLHAGDTRPALVYAGLDIDDLILGQQQNASINFRIAPNHDTWYLAAKPFEVIAARDIVGTGTTPSVFLNTSDNDISLVQAGRDIIYQSVTVAGLGLLQVQAGRNLYQGYYGSLVSVGDIVNPLNKAGGAGITALMGVGSSGPDYATFAKLYFDAANQLPRDTPLAGSGKVAKTYDDDLYDWLSQRFSPSKNYSFKGKSYVFTGSKDDALAFFLSLPTEQQGVFVRNVYYSELKEGGREYNDASSPRHGSYLRGRQAIATLFPDQDADGKPITYSGGLTMFSSITGTDFINGQNVPHVTDVGIQTQFGGGIQILNPGGRTLIGVEGVSPGAGAGLITQGSGDIDVYSLGSVLLGQSRIMTTFGGNILVWSATGDINAGRGSKTTTIFTPPKRTYDNYGNVSLSPVVPSAGAGIATLNPIPQVPPGDIDLIAPIGTIDAGEAGIRVSGNVNLAALQIVNAANIQVQGASTGIPTVQAPNISAALSTSNATAATQQTTAPNPGSGNERPSVIIVEFLGYGGGGDGEERAPKERSDRKRQDTQNYDPTNPLRILGNGPVSARESNLITDQERKELEDGAEARRM